MKTTTDEEVEEMLLKLRQIIDEKEIIIADIQKKIRDLSKPYDDRIIELATLIKNEALSRGENIKCPSATVSYEKDFNENDFESNIYWKKERKNWKDI